MGDGSGFQVDDDAPHHYQNEVWRFMGPFADALVSSSVSEGDAVLDAACGTGIATRAAASIVGGSGSVIGTDINSAMLRLAEAISVENEDGITWSQASALDLPYGDDRFDCVVCQQGVQFFPDPAAGLREMARVTRPGGTVAITVWSDLADSPYFDVMRDMLLRFCGVQPEDMAWSFTAVQIEDWFVSAGFSRPSVEQVNLTVALPPLHEFVPSHMRAVPWANQFFAISSEERAEAVRYMETRLGNLRTATGIDAPFGSHLATAGV
jgi:SAM-dependent methyltransferase